MKLIFGTKSEEQYIGKGARGERSREREIYHDDDSRAKKGDRNWEGRLSIPYKGMPGDDGGPWQWR